MFEKVKTYIIENQKIAMMAGGVIIVGGYFAYKYFTKRSRAKRLTRR